MKFCDCIREYGAFWYSLSVYPYRNVVYRCFDREVFVYHGDEGEKPVDNPGV